MFLTFTVSAGNFPAFAVAFVMIIPSTMYTLGAVLLHLSCHYLVHLFEIVRLLVALWYHLSLGWQIWKGSLLVSLILQVGYWSWSGRGSVGRWWCSCRSCRRLQRRWSQTSGHSSCGWGWAWCWWYGSWWWDCTGWGQYLLEVLY